MTAPTLKLKNYQSSIVNETIERYNNGKQWLYAAKMGSGKTLMAIASMQRLMDMDNVARVLVVCPNAVVDAWTRELVKWYEQGLMREPVDAINIKRFKKPKWIESLPETGMVVVNYESCWRKETVETEVIVDGKKTVSKQVTVHPAHFIEHWKPDMVICDEVHALGTPDSNQSKALHIIALTAKYRLGLSGTPIQNTPLNLWSVYKFIDDTVFHPSYTAFKARHVRCIRVPFRSPKMKGKFHYEQVGYRNLAELYAKFHANAVVLELADVVDMPPYRTVVVPVTMKEPDRAVMEAIKREGIRAISSGDQAGALTLATKLRRFLGGFVPDEEEPDAWKLGNTSKIEGFISLARELHEQQIKFAVFCQFTAEVDGLIDFCNRMGINAHAFYGQTKPDKRQYLIDEFQKGNIDCLVCQTSVAGTGITLTKGTASIFYSLSFKFVEKEQAEYRMWRIGQESMVTSYFLTTVDSYDEHVYNTVQNKQDVARSITAMKEMFADEE